MMIRFLAWFASLFTAIHVPRQFEGPLYLSRYYLFGRLGRKWRDWLPINLYLHHFHTSDEPIMHNHPWSWALSLMLVGGYVEHRLETWNGFVVFKRRTVRPGNFNWIPRDRWHYVKMREAGGYWTLVLSGPQWGKRWGFLFGDRGVVDSEQARRERLVGKTKEQNAHG